MDKNWVEFRNGPAAVIVKQEMISCLYVSQKTASIVFQFVSRWTIVLNIYLGSD